MLIFNICIIIEALTEIFSVRASFIPADGRYFFPGCGGIYRRHKLRQPAVSGAVAAASSGVRT